VSGTSEPASRPVLEGVCTFEPWPPRPACEGVWHLRASLEAGRRRCLTPRHLEPGTRAPDDRVGTSRPWLEGRGLAMEDTPRLEDTSLEACDRRGHGRRARAPAAATGRPARSRHDRTPPPSPPSTRLPRLPRRRRTSATEHRTGTTGPHPPLDEPSCRSSWSPSSRGRRRSEARRPRAHARLGRRSRGDHPARRDAHRTPLDEPPPSRPSASSSRRRCEATSRSTSRVLLPRRRGGPEAAGLGHERPDDPIPLLPRWRPRHRTRCRSHPPAAGRGPDPRGGRDPPRAGADLPQAEASAEPPAPPLSLVPPGRGPRGRPRLRSRRAPCRRAPRPRLRPRQRTAPVGTTELGHRDQRRVGPRQLVPRGTSRAARPGPGRRPPRGPVRLVREPGAPPRMLPPTRPRSRSGSGRRCRSSGRLPGPTSPAPWPVAGRGGRSRRPGRGGVRLEGGTVRQSSSWPPCSAGCATARRSSPPTRRDGWCSAVPGGLQHRPARAAARGRGARRLRGRRLVQAPTARRWPSPTGGDSRAGGSWSSGWGASTCDIAGARPPRQRPGHGGLRRDAPRSGRRTSTSRSRSRWTRAPAPTAAVLRKRIGEAAQLRTELGTPP
jgi:hypothetical protein